MKTLYTDEDQDVASPGVYCSALGCQLARLHPHPFCSYHWGQLGYGFHLEWAKRAAAIRRGEQISCYRHFALVTEAVLVLAEEEGVLARQRPQPRERDPHALRPW